MNVGELKLDTLMLSNTVSAQYKAADLLRNLNLHYDDAVAYIWSEDGSWSFDEGVGYLPIAKANIISGQSDYQLPSTARMIHKVEILDSKGGKHQIHPLTDKTERTLESTDRGLPWGYKMVGRSIILQTTPDYNYTKGLILHLSKSVTQLVNNTDEPKIDREFHRYLSYGATRDWYFSKSNITKQRAMDRELEKMKLAMRDFYGKRHKDFDASIVVQRENYR